MYTFIAYRHVEHLGGHGPLQGCIKLSKEGRTVVALKHPSQNDVIRSAEINRQTDRQTGAKQADTLANKSTNQKVNEQTSTRSDA